MRPQTIGFIAALKALDPLIQAAYLGDMNMHSKPPLPDQAVLHYGDGEYAVMKPGKFVVCAVSGKQILLEALRYWNPRTQEAYAGPQEATQRWKSLNP